MASQRKPATSGATPKPKRKPSPPKPKLVVSLDEKLLLTVEEFAACISLSRKTAYQLVMTKRVRSVTIGRLRRIPRAAVEQYVASLADAA